MSDLELPQATDVAAVWRAFAERLRQFIRGRVASAADAEEILQDVFARLHARRAELAEVARIDSWLYKVARNAIIDHHRAAAARERVVATTGESLDEVAEPPPDSAEEREPILRCMQPMMALLPDEAQTILTRVDIEGASMRDEATRLGLSVSATKSRVQRARAQLRDALSACCEAGFDGRGRLIELTLKKGREPVPGGGKCE